jgi:hypothetical protein
MALGKKKKGSNENIISSMSVGIIRWDAWNGRSGDVITGNATRVLSPSKFHWRLPWYANINGPNNVTIDGDRQPIVDKELELAWSAGIDYFAYDTYCVWPTDAHIPQCAGYWGGPTPTSVNYKPSDPSYALRRHLASASCHKVGIALVLLGAAPAVPEMRARHLQVMSSPCYHKVMSRTRPLVFLFQAQQAEADMNGGWAAWAKQWASFRAEAIDAGVGNPYFVAMGLTDARATKQLQAHLGFDAISAYALPGGSVQGVPFVEQQRTARQFWEAAAADDTPLVPIIPSGWDPRPRAQMGCPWVNETAMHYEQPTAEQLTDSFSMALEWMNANPTAAPAATAIAYAWNEVSEGGIIAPTVGNGTAQLDAVRAALRPPK